MERRSRLALFSLLYILSVLLAFSLGRYSIDMVTLVKILLSKVFPIVPTWTREEETIVFLLRLPRIALSSLIGGGLALSGLLLQSVFKNPLVSQDVLGSGEASAFGASLALLFGLPYLMVSVLAFLFGILSIVLVTLIARFVKGEGKISLILSGIIISSLSSSLVSFVKLVADTDETLPEITYFLMGSLSSYREGDILFIFVITFVVGIVSILLSWQYNLLALKEEEAISIGVNVRLLRVSAIFSSTLLTSAAVSISGQIGWVGLVIPHFARLIAGRDTRHLVPLSILLGATFLTFVDTLSRTLTSVEIPIGILTSFVGAPVFLYLIVKRGRYYEA